MAYLYILQQNQKYLQYTDLKIYLDKDKILIYNSLVSEKVKLGLHKIAGVCG